MSSDSPDSGSDRADTSSRSCPSKKTIGKVPRKTRKAAREKQKRDHINELFSDLGKALDLDHPNNGKASVIRESIRLLGELINQVDDLKKENAALFSESHYITTERNELLEETSALDAQIKSLQGAIYERTNHSNSYVLQPQSNSTAKPPETCVSFPYTDHASVLNPVISPLYVMPLLQESQGLPRSYQAINDVPAADVPCHISKPQPRYPSSSDSWPYHILNGQTNAVEDA